MNDADVYIFDNIVRTPFTIRGAPALISSLRRARLPGHKLNMLTNTGGQNLLRVSGGVSVQLSLISTHDSTFSVCFPLRLLSMVQPNSVNVLTPLPTPLLGVRVLPLERGGEMRREGYVSKSPD